MDAVGFFSPSEVIGVRILLTDKAIARSPTPKDGWYLARDTELKGFFVVVGNRKRTFAVYVPHNILVVLTNFTMTSVIYRPRCRNLGVRGCL